MTAERMTADAPARSRRGHEFRYHLAAGFVSPGDVVVDAACGTGYGRELLRLRGDMQWVGVDREPPDIPYLKITERVVGADLQTWEPDFDFDVWLGFETIEHLPDFSHYVEMAKRARRWILASVPVVPTTHLNEHHVHNFAPGEVTSLFVGDEWELYQSVLQPSELSEVYVFGRRA